MFERLLDRVEGKVREETAAIRRHVEMVLAALPDVQIRVEDKALVIEAKGLARRWLHDMRIRFAFWRRA